jgi:uncharacterized membrane protein
LADPLVVTVLAYGHILSAIGWLGGNLLTAFVIGPGLQTLSAPARLEFLAKLIPKVNRYVLGMVAGTFIFGILLLYFVIGGDFSMLSPSTTFGAAISAGTALAVITAILGVTVIFPSFNKMASIAEGVLKSGGQPPPPEMLKYAKRARVSSMTGVVLLLLVLVMMVAAGFY